MAPRGLCKPARSHHTTACRSLWAAVDLEVVADFINQHSAMTGLGLHDELDCEGCRAT